MDLATLIGFLLAWGLIIGTIATGSGALVFINIPSLAIVFGGALFEAKLAQLDLFPIYYKPGQPIKSREHQTMEAQGAFNRGDQTNAVVPALEPDTFPDEQKGIKK